MRTCRARWGAARIEAGERANKGFIPCHSPRADGARANVKVEQVQPAGLLHRAAPVSRIPWSARHPRNTYTRSQRVAPTRGTTVSLPAPTIRVPSSRLRKCTRCHAFGFAVSQFRVKFRTGITADLPSLGKCSKTGPSFPIFLFLKISNT